MSILSRLFGKGGSEKGVEPVDYEGFLIYPEPEGAGSQYRLRARIEKEIGGETKSYTLIRADMLESREVAETVSVDRAKRVIDEQGDRLFD